MDVADVVAPGLLAELPDRLEEREDLDVADRAADLGDHDVDVVGGDAADAPLDLVGDVRDHLHRLAEVVAAPLGGEHRLVDRAGRGVGVARQVLVDEALVVPEVEVGLAAVVGDEHLAVLERVHRARVDVDVRVELLQRHPQAAQLEQPAERRGREALAEGAGHPTGHEDVLRHRGPPSRWCGCRGCQPDGSPAYRGRGRRAGIARVEQLDGVLAGRLAAFGARQHAGQLVDPGVAVDGRAAVSVWPPATRFDTATWWSARAATWARWVTTSTWWLLADRGERLGRRPPPRRPPMPASTSSNTRVEASARSVAVSSTATSRSASIVRASSPPDATLRQRQRRRARVGREQELRRASPGSSSRDRRPTTLGVRHRQRRAAASSTAAPSCGAAARRAAPTAAAARRSASSACPPAPSRAPPPAPRSPRARRARSADLGVEAMHLGEVVAVLAAQVAELLTPGPDRGQPLGVLLDAVGHVARRSARCRRARRAAAARRSAAAAVRRPVAQPSGGGGDGVAAAAVVGEHRRARRRRPRRCATASASASSSTLEHGVLVGVVERGGVELGDLEAEQVDLAGAGPLVAAERGQLGVELGQPGPRGAQRGEVDAAEGSSAAPLRRPASRALVGVLAVQVDEPVRRLGERGRPWPGARRCRRATGRRPARPG